LERLPDEGGDHLLVARDGDASTTVAPSARGDDSGGGVRARRSSPARPTTTATRARLPQSGDDLREVHAVARKRPARVGVASRQADGGERRVQAHGRGPVAASAPAAVSSGAARSMNIGMAVGVDTAPAAVELARARGAPVLERSIFDRFPAPGRWGSAILLDGNVGIGGDPVALLHRIAALLRPGGRVLLELDPPGRGSRSFRARLDDGFECSAWFPWARLGADHVGVVAAAASLVLEQVWDTGGRWFACTGLTVPLQPDTVRSAAVNGDTRLFRARRLAPDLWLTAPECREPVCGSGACGRLDLWPERHRFVAAELVGHQQLGGLQELRRPHPARNMPIRSSRCEVGDELLGVPRPPRL
jgi:hypothetical protein